MMKKQLALLFCFMLAAFFLPATYQEAFAEPTITSGTHEDLTNSYLRGFSEIGFGMLLGTVAGGTPLITGVFASPHDLTLPLTLGAIFYPAGVASGMILGGYLTDSYSNYWAPFVGAYVGALFADVSALFLADAYPTFSALFVLIFPIVTSLAATEVSHYRHKRKAYYPVLLSFPF